MSQKPPFSTHPDGRGGAYASTPVEKRGMMAHALWPLTSPVNITLPPSQPYPPMPPIQPTYIPPSPHRSLHHQPIPPRNSILTSPYVSLRNFDWNLPPVLPTVAPSGHSTYLESSSPTLHHQPISHPRPSTMAPDVAWSRAPIPPCLEPSPRDRCTRFDPFAPRPRGAYNHPSPATFASRREPFPSITGHPRGHLSHRVSESAPIIPIQMDQDR